jgi:hypothetical protein
MPDGQPDGRRNKTEDDITAEVLARFSGTETRGCAASC